MQKGKREKSSEYIKLFKEMQKSKIKIHINSRLVNRKISNLIICHSIANDVTAFRKRGNRKIFINLNFNAYICLLYL